MWSAGECGEIVVAGIFRQRAQISTRLCEVSSVIGMLFEML